MVSGWFDHSGVAAPVAHKIQPHKSKLQQFISCHNNMFTHEINLNDAWYLGYMVMLKHRKQDPPLGNKLRVAFAIHKHSINTQNVRETDEVLGKLL